MRSSRVEWANWHLPSAPKGQCPARKYLQIFVKRLLAIRHNVAPGRTSSRRPRAVSGVVGASAAAATPGAPCRTRGGPSRRRRRDGREGRRADDPRGGTVPVARVGVLAAALAAVGTRLAVATHLRLVELRRQAPSGARFGGPRRNSSKNGRIGSARRPRRGTGERVAARPRLVRTVAAAGDGRSSAWPWANLQSAVRALAQRVDAEARLVRRVPGAPRRVGQLAGAGLGGAGSATGCPCCSSPSASSRAAPPSRGSSSKPVGSSPQARTAGSPCSRTGTRRPARRRGARLAGPPCIGAGARRRLSQDGRGDARVTTWLASSWRRRPAGRSAVLMETLRAGRVEGALGRRVLEERRALG